MTNGLVHESMTDSHAWQCVHVVQSLVFRGLLLIRGYALRTSIVQMRGTRSSSTYLPVSARSSSRGWSLVSWFDAPHRTPAPLGRVWPITLYTQSCSCRIPSCSRRPIFLWPGARLGVHRQAIHVPVEWRWCLAEIVTTVGNLRSLFPAAHLRLAIPTTPQLSSNAISDRALRRSRFAREVPPTDTDRCYARAATTPTRKRRLRDMRAGR